MWYLGSQCGTYMVYLPPGIRRWCTVLWWLTISRVILNSFANLNNSVIVKVYIGLCAHYDYSWNSQPYRKCWSLPQADEIMRRFKLFSQTINLTWYMRYISIFALNSNVNGLINYIQYYNTVIHASISINKRKK